MMHFAAAAAAVEEGSRHAWLSSFCFLSLMPAVLTMARGGPGIEKIESRPFLCTSAMILQRMVSLGTTW